MTFFSEGGSECSHLPTGPHHHHRLPGLHPFLVLLRLHRQQSWSHQHLHHRPGHVRRQIRRILLHHLCLVRLSFRGSGGLHTLPDASGPSSVYQGIFHLFQFINSLKRFILGESSCRNPGNTHWFGWECSFRLWEGLRCSAGRSSDGSTEVDHDDISVLILISD